MNTLQVYIIIIIIKTKNIHLDSTNVCGHQNLFVAKMHLLQAQFVY